MDVEVDLGPLVSPIWVDFSFGGSPKIGIFTNSYAMLADGMYHVSVGGTVILKGPRSSPETVEIR